MSEKSEQKEETVETSVEITNGDAIPSENTPLNNGQPAESRKSSVSEKSESDKFNWKHPAVLATAVVLGIAVIVGIAVGIYFAVSGSPEEVPITLPDGSEIVGYKGEWSEWTRTPCSVSCGEGHLTVQRTCLTKDDSLENVFCDAKNGTLESFQFEVEECELEKCIAGRVVVEDTILNLKNNLKTNNVNFDDKEFLKRYAQSVTEYGDTVNVGNGTDGHGIWRIVDNDAASIFQNMPNRRRRADTLTISRDYRVNVKLMCKFELTDNTVLESQKTFLEFLDKEPCASAAAILTILTIQNRIIPRNPDEQEALLKQVTNQQIVPFNTIIEQESQEIKARCGTQDIDFEFLIDSSGSIGADEWRVAVTSIGNEWIEQAIVPVFNQYGNHVAARWFSSSSARFINFQHTAFLSSGKSDYAEYLGGIMRSAPYVSGGTDTANALTQIASADLPTSRHLHKNKTIVFVFTDGQSNDQTQTLSAASRLKKSATVFSLAIGGNTNEIELNAISTSGSYTKVEGVNEIKALVTSILNDQAVCGEYDCENIFRNANPTNMRTKGCSKHTGKDFSCALDCSIDDPSQGIKNEKTEECIACSHQIARSQLTLFNDFKIIIQSASKKYAVDEFLIAGLISKLTNVGSDLDEKGYVPCAPYMLQDPNDKIECFGLMRVPVDRFKSIQEMEQKGPYSEESISLGIELLMEIAQCVCESTKLSLRKTIEDIIMINERAIAAYQVGCSAVPPSGDFNSDSANDLKDMYHYDFSNDVIARAQLFTSELKF